MSDLEFVHLADAPAQPEELGAKASTLAAALQAGLPVLPGLVVPVRASRAALETASAVAAGGGVHAGRLSVMDTPLRIEKLRQAAAELDQPLVARSSSPLEDGGRYAGAFSSYQGIAPGELDTAVRGVWASALTERAETARSGMAVLVQPEVTPWLAGTASVSGELVEVVYVTGSPAPLLAGVAAGDTVRVDGAGRADDPSLGEPVASGLRRVAELARRVHELLGADLIEWALTEPERVLLLQAGRSASRPAPPERVQLPAPPPVMVGVARLVYAFAGDLGEQILLPALLPGATAESCAPRVTGATAPEPAAAWAEARALSARLAAGAWPADLTPAAFLHLLRTGAFTEAADRLARLTPPPADQVRRLCELLAGVRDALLRRGVLRRPEEFWSLPAERVADQLTGGASLAPAGKPSARWTPFVHAAVAGSGRQRSGVPAVPGVAVGVAVLLSGPPTALPGPGAVLVAPHPIPQLAPLLWGAAGLVTFGGSVGAHVVEVAKTVGVPTVIAVGDAGSEELSAGRLVAVDGDLGLVSVDRRPLFAA